MSRITAQVNTDSSIVLPLEALKALGIDVGASVAIEVVGRAVVVRSVEEAQRSREFVSAFGSILTHVALFTRN